jgi:MAP3K TRAFs-binding domain
VRRANGNDITSSSAHVDRDTDLRPLCFVLMPFGTKRDLAGGVVEFDAVYREVIRPAVEAADLQCVRADEEHVGGIIHKPMFERLLLCEYAVADLSTANANVYYELGVRHATRPWSTILTFAQGFRLPFDMGPLRGLRYHLDNAGRPSQAVADCAALTKSLRAARAQMTDSPLFQLLKGLSPPDVSALSADVFHQRVKASTRIQDKLAEARRQGTAAINSVQSELGDLRDVESGLIIDLLLSYGAVEAYPEMIQLVENMPTALAQAALVREQYAFALNRLKRSEAAETVLTQLIHDRGPSSETYGLLGRVYKDRWDAAQAEKGKARAQGLLDKAIDAYVKGFETDWRDHYPGINAVELMSLRDPPDPRREELLPVVRYSVRQKIRSGHTDYWDHATILELAVLDNDEDAAFRALADALASDPEPWKPRSTLVTLQRLRQARERTGDSPPWLYSLEEELTRASARIAGDGAP